MKRRSFVASTAGLGLAPYAAAAGGSDDTHVWATGDGIPHTPEQTARLLLKLTEGGKVDPDFYSRDGVITKLEQRVAADLGKEAGVWMATGTLANQMAVRMLAGDRRRVLLQAESHLYNDCGDCCQTLSGLTTVPLAPGKATFTLEEVEATARRGDGGRVAVPIGAIQIESPVRRKAGERFDFDQMKKISAWARERKIGMHLDGARLPLEAAYSGVSLKEYASLFDTVFTSMWKYCNAPSGAMLVGPKALLEDAYHMRRMFGGGLPHAWPFAAISLHYWDGFPDRYKTAVATGEAVKDALSRDSNFEIRPVASGTNIFHFRVRGVNALVYQQRLLLTGVTVGAPVNEWFSAQVNETWNRASAADIVKRFQEAMG